MNDWLLAQGGLVGLGVAAARDILLLFSVASVAVMIERLWTLARLKSLENATYSQIRDALARRDFAALNQIAAQNEAPCAGILKVGLEHTDAGEVRLREAMNQEVTNQLAALAHNLPILATAASTAPYLGLFGTVLGILAAFRDIARTGQTGASVIAGGISEALTATALGLGVAIPAVLAYNFFTARISSLSLPIKPTRSTSPSVWRLRRRRNQSKLESKMRIEPPGARRGARSHNRPAPMAEINIIPLVDVVLVLLIIFMATTAFVK